MQRSMEYDCSIQDCKQKKRVTEERDKQNRAMDGLIPEAECIVCLEMSMTAKMVTFNYEIKHLLVSI